MEVRPLLEGRRASPAGRLMRSTTSGARCAMSSGSCAATRRRRQGLRAAQAALIVLGQRDRPVALPSIGYVERLGRRGPPAGDFQLRRDRRGMQAALVVRKDEKSCKERLPSFARDDLRSLTPSVRAAGISGYGRLSAGIQMRDIRGMRRSRRSFAPGQATQDADCRNETGATGLEPATSGVTGLFQGNDDWRR